MASLLNADATLWTWISCIGLSLVHFSFYIYNFCLANQIVGVEEDGINKPDREVPSGRLSIQGAWLRWTCAMFAFPLVAFLINPELVVWAIL